uniref:Uncharacterized protein n=1 Tax=Nelumbo nucifera TaxID=4432 RepID=A0A822XG19_NELNU|nr:TPA_asm: hypothetical protein HUJ06_020803 [Nelumbo nucifera]
MAAEIAVAEETPKPSNDNSKLLSSYLGLSFAIFLGFIPRASWSLVSTLQARNRNLAMKLFQAEEQIRQMKSRRKEDSKANARVVEIFASHRNTWQQEEKKLLQQIEASAEEIAHLRAKVDELEKNEVELRMCIDKLQREVEEREDMISLMSRKTEDEEYAVGSVERLETDKDSEIGGYESQDRGGYARCVEDNGLFGDYSADFTRFGKFRVSKGLDPISEECFLERNSEADEMALLYSQQNGFSQDFLPSASKLWAERTNSWKVRASSSSSPPRLLFFSLFLSFNSFICLRVYLLKLSSSRNVVGFAEKIWLLAHFLSWLKFGKDDLLVRRNAFRGL